MMVDFRFFFGRKSKANMYVATFLENTQNKTIGEYLHNFVA